MRYPGVTQCAATIDISGWMAAVYWYGWANAMKKYRWGKVGTKWPTYYLGPLKVITGPSRLDTWENEK